MLLRVALDGIPTAGLDADAGLAWLAVVGLNFQELPSGDSNSRSLATGVRGEELTMVRGARVWGFGELNVV